MMENKSELIELRRSFLPYEKAVEVIEKLRVIYESEYKPKHSKSTYNKLIMENDVGDIELVHPQTSNYPDKIYCAFSVASQHVYGFTKEHCLDKIYDAVKKKKERIKKYVLLPTLSELVNSETKIEKETIYYYKEKNSCEDSCNGIDGASILEMREIGIDTFRLNNFKNMLDNFFIRDRNYIIK
jgi:hypothetical protein